MENTNKVPELGDVVKVYFNDVFDRKGGGYIANSKFGIVVKADPGMNIHLQQTNQKYELHEVNWFLDHGKVKFV